MSARYPFTRDYRLRDQGFTGRSHIPKREAISQNSKNDDLPSALWVICGSLIFIGLFFIWVWLLAALVEPQTVHKHSPYVSFHPSAHDSSSTVSKLSEDAFYSETSELLTRSGVLDRPDVNDGWED